MKVNVDGQSRDWNYTDSMTLRDVLIDVNKRLLIDEKKIIAEIKVDETVPGLDMNLTPEMVTLDQVVSVSFLTAPFMEVLVESLTAAQEKLSTVKSSINEIVGHIISDEIDVAMGQLKEGIDILIWFFDSLQQATICGVMSIEKIQLSDGTLKEFIDKLNGMLNELVTAMKNNDFTLINDYLEYEVEPAIEELVKAIPKIISNLKGN
jgi:hypothetical protein